MFHSDSLIKKNLLFPFFENYLFIIYKSIQKLTLISKNYEYFYIMKFCSFLSFSQFTAFFKVFILSSNHSLFILTSPLIFNHSN